MESQDEGTPDDAPRHPGPPCDNFLYGFKGAPPARQRRASARTMR
jgi:hypothetical protein